jgi:hypothetical protein
LDVIPDTARVPSQVKSDVIAIVKGRLPVARESWMEAVKTRASKIRRGTKQNSMS